MTYEIRCCGPRREDRPPDGARVFNVTSRSSDACRALSPFLLRPHHGLARNVENYWQFSKVFPEHWSASRMEPHPEWYDWRNRGWDRERAVRHPMGKGARPVCSWVEGVGPLGYILARELLYIPSYILAVRNTPEAVGAVRLIREAAEKEPVWLWDFDTYDHLAGLPRSIDYLIQDSSRPLGHGFLVWALVTRAKIDSPLSTWNEGTANE